jgi:glycosyltransferase involved in cell wall biosynthesis
MRPVVAIVPWGLAIEDFLSPNGLSLDDFCNRFTGSWMFGVVEALRRSDVDAVIIAVSSGVERVERRRHEPTGAPISLLPLPRVPKAARRSIPPYARTVEARGRRALVAPLLFGLKEAAPYLSTPVRALARELRRHGCGAILCQEYEFPRFDVCVGVGRTLGMRTFGIFQGGDYRRWRSERVVRPLAMRLADGFVVGPAAEAVRIRDRYRIPDAKVARIPNPIDVAIWRRGDRETARAELGIAGAERVVAWHGRVELRKKGLDVLVDAWSSLSAGHPDGGLRLLLIGGGGDAPEVRARLERGGLRNVVWVDRHLHEPRRIAGLLAAADVYAFPSRHEGFPVAPIEAMACGLPVVAADTRGVEDVLGADARAGGVLVPPDDPESLAAELERLLMDDAARAELAARARRRAEEFDSTVVGQRLHAFLFPSGSRSGE